MATSHQQVKSYTDFNLVPLPANAVPLGSGPFIPNPRFSNSLSRLGELQKFLVQCEDPSYYGNYYQLLNSATPDMLQDAYKSLKERAKWLDDQQNIEIGRMKSLNIVPAAVGNALKGPLDQTPPALNSQGAPLITNVIGTNNYKNVSGTPEVTAVPGLPGPVVPAALEHQLLMRDSVTPPTLASIDNETDNKGRRGRKKGAQAKINKRKRT